MNHFHTASPPALIRKSKQSRMKNEIDEFLSSDLELSFASTMSLNSPAPSRAASPMDMDISPAPIQQSQGFLAPPSRQFGRDLLNSESISSMRSAQSKSKSKGLQRSALPMEWISPVTTKDTSFEGFSVPVIKQTSPDAMDIDSSPSAPTGIYAEPSSPPSVPGLANTNYSNLFFDSSPVASASPAAKKRRSISPEPNILALASSDPPSSPSHTKFARAATVGVSGSLFKKPALEYNAPSTKRLPGRRPTISAIVPRGDELEKPRSAIPILTTAALTEVSMPPPRRAFSAMISPDQVLEPSSDDISDHQASSPAAAYAKRHHARVIRRCDGSEDLRPLHSAGSLQKRDREVFESKGCSPKSLAGFGMKEVQKKLLPCHRVADDGLMRITSATMMNLLKGVYSSQVASFTVVDCRFDYEYAGGHIPGAINFNTTTSMMDYFLGSNRPSPCESGDAEAKHIVVFHCEFSVKRAPTFAKNIRSKDRAINGRVYPKICYPEMYILEGGYSQFYHDFSEYCEPRGYVRMDDPAHAQARDADMDNFRRGGKWARTQSYTYGQTLNGRSNLSSTSNNNAISNENRKTAPTGGMNGNGTMFAAATAARGRRVTSAKDLGTLDEDVSSSLEEGDSIDLHDSPCPPPSKTGGRLSALLPLGAGKNPRSGFERAVSFGPATSIRR